MTITELKIEEEYRETVSIALLKSGYRVYLNNGHVVFDEPADTIEDDVREEIPEEKIMLKLLTADEDRIPDPILNEIKNFRSLVDLTEVGIGENVQRIKSIAADFGYKIGNNTLAELTSYSAYQLNNGLLAYQMPKKLRNYHFQPKNGETTIAWGTIQRIYYRVDVEYYEDICNYLVENRIRGNAAIEVIENWPLEDSEAKLDFNKTSISKYDGNPLRILILQLLGKHGRKSFSSIQKSIDNPSDNPKEVSIRSLVNGMLKNGLLECEYGFDEKANKTKYYTVAENPNLDGLSKNLREVWNEFLQTEVSQP